MNIPLESEPYWNYYEALAVLINRILTMAEGGQLITQGTDIMSPALLERAKLTIAEFEKFSPAIENVTATLQQNLNVATQAFARKSA